MCTVYEFPKNLVLPHEEAEVLELLGEAYVKALYNSLFKMLGPNSASSEEMEEVGSFVNDAFAMGMTKAVKQMEES